MTNITHLYNCLKRRIEGANGKFYLLPLSPESLDTAVFQRIIFIGVSLTDPNMRRWLSWMQKLKETEVLENGIIPEKVLKQSYSHYWVNKKPDNIEEIEWIEACVKHLGIKIIWLDKWEDLHQTLKLMIE